MLKDKIELETNREIIKAIKNYKNDGFQFVKRKDTKRQISLFFKDDAGHITYVNIDLDFLTNKN